MTDPAELDSYIYISPLMLQALADSGMSVIITRTDAVRIEQVTKE